MNLITHFLVVLSLVSLSMSTPYRRIDDRDRHAEDRYGDYRDKDIYDRYIYNKDTTTPYRHVDNMRCYIGDKVYGHCEIMPDGCMCVHGMADCSWSPVSEELALYCPDLEVGMTKTPPSTHAPYGYYDYDYDYDYSEETKPTTQRPTTPKPPTHPPTKPPTHPPTTPKPPTHPPTKPPTHPPTKAPTHPPTKAPTHPPTTKRPVTNRPTRPPTSMATISWDGLKVILKEIFGLTDL